MRVEIKRNVMISGEPAAAGSFVELEDAAAMLLIGMGKAVFAPAAKPEPDHDMRLAPVRRFFQWHSLKT